jgi:hypothetical protein
MSKFYSKDLIDAIKCELESTVQDMLGDPDNYGLPGMLDHPHGAPQTLVYDESEDSIMRVIAEQWLVDLKDE